VIRPNAVTPRELAAIAILATLLLVGFSLITLRNEPHIQVVTADQPTSVQPAISINNAGVEELMLLPGIGPNRAQSIVTDRSRNGPYSSVDSLKRIHGIGPGIVNAIRDYVIVEK
jgi:competence ComEA-like helix-hairpin-helix protein